MGQAQDIQHIAREKYNNDTTHPDFKNDIEAYKRGVPVAYIIGVVPFLGCTIDVSYRPLIPRPETEYWVEQFIQTLPIRSDATILDLFSGSGCIGVAIALHRPLTTIHFADNDTNALRQINKNRDLHGITQRSRTIKSNVFSNISHTSYHAIVANPPYISIHAHDIEDSVTRYEPHNALFAPDNGFYYLEKTIQHAHHYLKQNGTLVIEHDPHHTQRIHTAGRDTPYTKIRTHKDQYNRERYTVLQK